MKHILPVLIALAVALGVYTVRPEESFPVGNIEIVDGGVFDRDELASELGDLELHASLNVLVHVGEGSFFEDGCQYSYSTCIAPLHPDFFENGIIRDHSVAIWVRQSDVVVDLPRYGVNVNDVREAEIAFDQTLTAAFVDGQLDEAAIAGAVAAADDAFYGDTNADKVMRGRIIQSILAGLLAGGLAWLIASAIAQQRAALTYRTRAERRRAITRITDRFTRASHSLDEVELSLLPRALIADWTALYVELTRALQAAGFLTDDYSRTRYDALIAELDRLSADLDDQLGDITAGKAPREGEQAPRISTRAVARRRKLPISPRVVAAGAAAAILAGIMAGAGTALAGDDEMVEYARAEGLEGAETQRAPEGRELAHFSSITIDDQGGLIEDEEELKQNLMKLGFEGSVPLQILTTDMAAENRFDLWEQWLVPTYPQFMREENTYSFEFDDTDGTVFLWLSPTWRGIDYNRVSTPLNPSGTSPAYKAALDPKGQFVAEGSAEAWVWNTLVSLAHWSVTPDPNVTSLASRAYGRGITVALISLPIALLLIGGGHAIYRRATTRRRMPGEIREITTSLTLAHEALHLDTIALASSYPGITGRFEQYERTYRELVRRAGTEHTADYERAFAKLSRDDQDDLAALARLASAQSASLWRARPIIERQPLWKRTWAAELAPYAHLEKIKIKPGHPADLDRALTGEKARALRGLAGATNLDLDIERADERPAPTYMIGMPRTRAQKVGAAALAAIAIALAYNPSPERNAYGMAYLGEPSEVTVGGDGAPVAVEAGWRLGRLMEWEEDLPIDVEKVKRAARSANAGFGAHIIIESGPAGTCTEDMIIESHESDVSDAVRPYGEFVLPRVVTVCIDPSRALVAGPDNIVVQAPLPVVGEDLTQSFIDYFTQEGPLFGRRYLVYPRIDVLVHGTGAKEARQAR